MSTENEALAVEEDEEGNVVKASEMYKGRTGSITRVDAVKGAASGMPFLVLKAGAPQDPASIAALQQVTDVLINKQQETPMSAPTEAPVAPTAEVAAADAELRVVAKKRRKDAPAEPTAPTDTPAPVAKADGEPDLDASGDVLVSDGAGTGGTPGSGAWEQIDADTAQRWTAILGRSKIALQQMADREGQEVAAGNDDEAADNAWDLEDACAAVDFAVGVLAAYAAGEQTEADAESEGVFKALAGQDIAKVSASLDRAEGLLPVAKSGRVLSASNEQSIRDAVASLQGVLSSLPAPVADPVAKALDPAVAAPEPVIEPTPVAKAKGDPMVACYNAAGELIGVVDAGNLVAVGAGKAADPADDEADAEADTPDAAAPDATAAAAATPAAAPAAPAAAPVAKAQDTPTETPADQPAIDEIVATAVAKALEQFQEDNLAVAKELKELRGHMERTPRPGGPLLNGMADSANGLFTRTESGALVLRGQSDSPIPEPVQAVLKALSGETDPLKQIDLQKRLALETLKSQQGMNG